MITISVNLILSSLFSLIAGIIDLLFSPGYSELLLPLINMMYEAGKPLVYGSWQEVLNNWHITSVITFILLDLAMWFATFFGIIEAIGKILDC